MKNSYAVVSVSSILLSFASISSADGGLGLGARIGTTGLSADITVPILTNRLNLRGSYNTFEYSADVDDTEVSYNAEFKINSVSLMADLHPFGNGFRLSAGLFNYFDNELSGHAVPAAGTALTVNGIDYDASELTQLDLKAEFESLAPYVGIGWGNSAGKSRLSLSVDIGLINIGSPAIDIDYTCFDPIICATIDADVQAEIAEVEADVEDFQWWPVLSVGFAFRF